MQRCELTGWLLFVASACFFIWAGARSGDLPTIVGSVLFLVACLFFLAPLRTVTTDETQRDETA